MLRVGHGRPVVRRRCCGRRRARARGCRVVRRRGAARARVRHPVVPRGRRRRPGRLGQLKRAGELPESLVLKTSVLLPCANPATARALEELGATTINVATDLSAGELGETPLGVQRPARRVRRGARRPGRLRALLRGARGDPGGGARVCEARPPQRAEHLSVRSPPRRCGGQARPRARAARGARAAAPARAGTKLVEGRGDDAPPDLGIPEP